MANEQNLIPNEQRTPEERRENAKKAGIASGKARKEKANIRRALEMLLERDYPMEDGSILSGAEVIALRQMERALDGDTKAFEVIRDSSGQKPVDKVEMKTDVNIEESTARLKSLFDGIANNDG